MAEMGFDAKVVLISGAGRGLGREAAAKFAAQGARLVLNDHDAGLLETTLDILKREGAKCVGAQGDISLGETSSSLVDLALSEFGRLDIAVNNAGIAQTQMRLHETPSKLAKRIMDVDLMGVFHAMQHQLPAMLKTVDETGDQCNIVNIASAAGVMGAPMIAAYSAAKHGVVGITKSAAMEYARKNIRINAICPAFTRTNMVTDILEMSKQGVETAEARLVANNPMGRLGEINEIVQAILWTCHSENSFFTGQALSVDGGLSA